MRKKVSEFSVDSFEIYSATKFMDKVNHSIMDVSKYLANIFMFWDVSSKVPEVELVVVFVLGVGTIVTLLSVDKLSFRQGFCLQIR